MSYRIGGLDCAEEVSVLRREVGRLPGVYDLRFDVFRARMDVDFDLEKLTARQIESAVEHTGMRAEPWSHSGAEGRSWAAVHAKTALAAVSGVLLVAGLLWEGLRTGNFAGVLLAHGGSADEFSLTGEILLILAAAAGLAPTFPKALAAARALRPDMNALVTISALGACILREWSEAATVSFLFAGANLLEGWSLGRARRAIGDLMNDAPSEAYVLHGDHGHMVAVEKVKVGSHVLVRPGERIPFDGVIHSGESEINQALITGESVPVPKQAGSRVFAGTVNGDGSLEIVTACPAADTTIARVLRMVEASQRHRTQSEKWVERFAAIYTPIMICLSLAVFLILPVFFGKSWQFAVYQAMVVLVISCPCALVISTPVSIVAALTAAARRGVLIKGGEHLETAARLSAIAFDKTGVLTLGQPEVSGVTVLNGTSEREVLSRLAHLEARSEHPLARAVTRYAAEFGIPAPAPWNVRALPGRGAEADCGGATFWAGNVRLAAERLGEAGAASIPARAGSETLLICGTGASAEALVTFRDRVRPEAAGVIAAVRQLGVTSIAMLTGDSRLAASAAASALKIDDVHAELLPEDKVEAVRKLRTLHRAVGMVGDGINDARAMAESSLGIAVGAEATGVAMETADIILMSRDLSQLPFLLRHARRTAAIIWQNAFTALALKVVFLGFASFGLATLWMAIMADMGATLLVTLNGLRLLRTGAARS